MILQLVELLTTPEETSGNKGYSLSVTLGVALDLTIGLDVEQGFAR
jgi:hypothetical protein